MTTIQAEGVFKLIETLLSRFVSAVGQPAPGLEQNCRSKETVAVPPMARASGRAAEAEDALIIAVDAAALFS